MHSGKQINQVVKQIGFVLLIVGLFVLIFTQLAYYLSSFLGAITLYLLLRTPNRKLMAKGWNRDVSTSFLLVLIILLLSLIGMVLFFIVYYKARQFDPEIIMDNLNNIMNWIGHKMGYNILSEDLLKKSFSSFTSYLPGIFSVTGSIIANACMMAFLLFFMLRDTYSFEAGIEKNFPFSEKSLSMIKKEAKNMVVSNAIGIPVIIISQSLCATFGYWLLDAGDPIIWGTLTGLFGILPIIGTAGIWIPLSIGLFLQGHVWQGIVLLLYGSLVIAGIDNLIRMVLLKKYADVHPLITIFGVVLGLSLFGFWGIIFGPLLISGFLLMLKIYKVEFLSEQNPKILH